ncbi:MAG: hypothetical protein HUJ97_01885 [Bacteroidales bacterium]|nr:hypothetical protein [Bacteroidales bacterium]
MEKLVRINKYLSDAGICSRRDVDTLIETGRIEVNGVPARIGMQIDTSRDKVTVDGELVDPAKVMSNAISEEVLMKRAQHTPWWVEHNMVKEAQLEELKKNPKSKLLRKGKKNMNKKSVSTKSLSQLKAEAARVSAIKTRGHSAADKQAKNEALQAANKEVAKKQAVRDENRKAKSLSEAIAKLKNPAHDLKERRVEGVNPKAATLRKKKTQGNKYKRR